VSDTILGSSAPEGIELGRSFAGQIVRSNKDHILIFGGTGSGKGVGLLMPALLDMRGNRSVFVVCPKGELPAVTAPFRRTQGRVVILNPFGVLTEYQGYEDLRGVGYNPLASLDCQSEDFNMEAGLLAEAMIAVNAESKNKYFEYSARIFTGCVIMYVVIRAWQNKKVPTMAEVRELICMEGERLVRLAQVMQRSWCVGLRNKAAQFTKQSRSIQDVVATAQQETEWIDDPQIARSMARNDFDFAELKQRPTTVYLVLPPHLMERHSKWLRLLVTAALRAAMRSRDENEPSILFMLDEIAQIGHLRIIEQTWTIMRGYGGVQLMAVFQDLLQMQDIYSKRAGSLIANSGAVLFLRPNDPTTAEWLSKRLGETTRMLKTMNESENQSGGQNNGRSYSPTGESQSGGASKGWGFPARSVNTSPVKVPLTLPHELYGLRDGEMRVFLSGVKDGLTLEAVPYFQIEKLDLRARRNPYVHAVPRRRDLPPPSERRGSVPPVGASGFDWSKWFDGITRSDPTPAPWGQPPTLPSPPSRRGLPPPEDWDDFEDYR
jgi:type IV secretory pathway TraG/TraD family ATPase VirD4